MAYGKPGRKKKVSNDRKKAVTYTLDIDVVKFISYFAENEVGIGASTLINQHFKQMMNKYKKMNDIENFDEGEETDAK